MSWNCRRSAILSVLLPLLLAPLLLQARRLPIKTYTTADGLARDYITCIVQDSHGFLWFCTAEGLSRFDGYSFANYHVEQGLPSNFIEDFLETREGKYWIATSGGLCRFDPARAPGRFSCFPLEESKAISSLYQDPSGVVWAGGPAALYRIDSTRNILQSTGIVISAKATVIEMVTDRDGTLWIGTTDGLYRHRSNGETSEVAGFQHDFIMALITDHLGRLWIGTRTRLVQMKGDEMRTFTTKDGLPSNRIESLLETADHTLWIGTNQGLLEWPESRQQQQKYSLAQGLTAHAVGPLAEDRAHNLWIGTFGSGLMKVAHSGFSTYTEADGVPFADAFLSAMDGQSFVISRGDQKTVLERFDGRTFVPIHLGWPQTLADFGWGRGQIGFQSKIDHAWWIASGSGLYRFTNLASPPDRRITTRDGLPGNNIFRLFEDSRGDIWIGTVGPNSEDGLARWSRGTNTVHAFTESEGFRHSPVPTAFAEDRNGAIWITFFHGGVARFSRKGVVTSFENARIPGFLNDCYADSAGRIWIGSSRGLFRFDDPSGDRFLTYKSADGLASNAVQAITEDHWGRIYAATGRGVDRFEPLSTGLGHIKHYTTADGLAPGEVNLAFRDSAGALWFGSSLGVSRLIPAQETPRSPPPVLLTGLTVAGAPQPVSDLGQATVSGLRLPQSSLRIDFVGLDYSPGEALRYQYMLEGADREWGRLTDQRSVVYANLASGGYRFLVRAVTSDGAVSVQPATVAFTVMPPLWRSWWFITLCSAAAVGIALGLHRYRMAQLLAVGAVRTSIATDLHDDIGASLSQIAVLSEVALRTHNDTFLHEIAAISRELIDGMSDIVWAINPEHDYLSNLVYRMRRIATDLLSGQDISLQFESSLGSGELRIPADIRRHVYLIFKETIHNIARHSHATHAAVSLKQTGDKLELRVADNGLGFDPAGSYEGRGLINIRKRTAAIQGDLQWVTSAGQGAQLLLTISIARR